MWNSASLQFYILDLFQKIQNIFNVRGPKKWKKIISTLAFASFIFDLFVHRDFCRWMSSNHTSLLMISIFLIFQETQNDCYCWICHKEGDVICCETCPRVFHLKCIQLETAPTGNAVFWFKIKKCLLRGFVPVIAASKQSSALPHLALMGVILKLISFSLLLGLVLPSTEVIRPLDKMYLPSECQIIFFVPSTSDKKP